MERVNLLLLADLMALLVVLTTAVGPLLRELQLLGRTTKAALQRLRMTRALRRRMIRVEQELELLRPASLAQMPAPTQLQPLPQRLTTRVEKHPRLRLPQLLQQARAMTMS
jgi:hypothetical protein